MNAAVNRIREPRTIMLGLKSALPTLSSLPPYFLLNAEMKVIQELTPIIRGFRSSLPVSAFRSPNFALEVEASLASWRLAATIAITMPDNLPSTAYQYVSDAIGTVSFANLRGVEITLDGAQVTLKKHQRAFFETMGTLMATLNHEAAYAAAIAPRATDNATISQGPTYAIIRNPDVAVSTQDPANTMIETAQSSAVIPDMDPMVTEAATASIIQIPDAAVIAQNLADTTRDTAEASAVIPDIEATAILQELGDTLDEDSDAETPTIKEEHRAYFKALGAYVCRLRKQAGLTQAALARELHVSQQAVFAYELGDRRISVLVLRKLSEIFDLPIEMLAYMREPVEIPEIPRAVVLLAQRLHKLSQTDRRFVQRIVDTLSPENASSAHVIFEPCACSALTLGV